MAALEDSDFDMYVDEDSDMEMMSDGEENVAPPSKKGSKKTAPKASKAGNNKPNPILSPRNANVESSLAQEGEKGKPKTIEERYQKKSQREHVLIRPDTYIGSVMPITEEMFVYDADQDAIVKKEITYTPGLFKIFDESKYNKKRRGYQRTNDSTKFTHGRFFVLFISFILASTSHCQCRRQQATRSQHGQARGRDRCFG
jgi:hypothetical protein